MKTKYTPGPWVVPEQESASHNISIVSPDPTDPDCPWNVAIAIGACGYPNDQARANARLIAAAPALVEALKEACEEIRELRRYANNHGGMYDSEEYEEGLTALSQALGGE